MKTMVIIAAGIVCGAAIGLCSVGLQRHVFPGKAIACDLTKISGEFTADDARRRCGDPWMKNVHTEGSDVVEEWVYDASTFLWFRNGSLSSWKAPI